MNEIVLLILNYLPPVLSVGALGVIAKIIISSVSKKLEESTRILKETQELKGQLSLLNKRNREVIELVERVVEENEELKLQLKGVITNGKVKKN